MIKVTAKKVYVAMSGGVDSSVAAALLKKKGYEVTGVFFKPWQPDKGLAFCNWEKDRRDAIAVAEVLGIPFKTWDFSKEYKNKVGVYMIEAYRQGITPNPDVMCNKEIKFGLFLKKALKEGADFIATGHYVQLRTASDKRQATSQKKIIPADNLKPKTYSLFQAKDKNKDQSYFLWTLTQEQLKYCLFPIGDYTKPEVRKLAKKFNLSTFDKKDSQGVCFIGQLNMKEFLKKYIKPKPGKIILQVLQGSPVNRAALYKVVGMHERAVYYTIGQRHGLNIANGGGPYYVSGKDLKKNLVFVTKDEKKLGEKEITISNLNWINPQPKVIHTQGSTLRSFKVKARYRTPAVPAKVIHTQGSTLRRATLRRVIIRTSKPIRAVTPGQSVVFYRGKEVLGGGIISPQSTLRSIFNKNRRKVFKNWISLTGSL